MLVHTSFLLLASVVKNLASTFCCLLVLLLSEFGIQLYDGLRLPEVFQYSVLLCLLAYFQLTLLFLFNCPISNVIIFRLIRALLWVSYWNIEYQCLNPDSLQILTEKPTQRYYLTFREKNFLF